MKTPKKRGAAAADPQAAPSELLRLSPKERTRFRAALLRWYQEHQRKLPWRGAPSPYGVWVSEVMLQQTRVEVVRDYYSRWMEKFPTLSDLARSKEDEVLHLWQGLGYYSRARRLWQGAKYVEQELGGQLPSEPEVLTKIPGIGPYSAGAISSIAFGRPSAIVDGNVIRVLCRYFALHGDPNRKPLKETLWSLSGQLVPQKEPGAFNQSVMELGATVCVPRSPLCHSCPLHRSCLALKRGEVHLLPQLPKPKEKTPITLAVVVLRRPARTSGKSVRSSVPRRFVYEYGFVKLPPEARWWAQMDVLPYGEVKEGSSVLDVAREVGHKLVPLEGARFKQLEAVSHTVTRFALSLVPVVVESDDAFGARSTLSWVAGGEVSRLAVPSAYKKVLTQVEHFDLESGK